MERKKFLYITHLSGKRVNRLWLSALTAASELGYEVHLACNKEQIEQPGWDNDCRSMGIIDHHIPFNRKPLNKENIKAYNELLNLMESNQFDIVHCNTPIGGVLGRLCAKRAKVPSVIYQAHGFHFWKGAPLKNWLLYYPVEKFLARYTDELITINKEDYKVAKDFTLKENGNVDYVNGVGVKCSNLSETSIRKSNIRKELSLPEDAIVFLSVGELNNNKNHSIAIRAFAKANISNAYYLICGEGNLRESLSKLIFELNQAQYVHLLGYRMDMQEILKTVDYFVFPSLREGLSVAQMEAMAAGLPCIVSKIRGNVDLLGDEYPYYFEPNNERELMEKMKKIVSDDSDWKTYSLQKIKSFDFNYVVDELKEIYQHSCNTSSEQI